MSFAREEPNPLRPYAAPLNHQPVPPSTSPSGTGSQSRTNAPKPASSARSSHRTPTRDILSNVDYGDFVLDASPSVTEMIKSLVDQGLWRYTSVLLAQPFEVAKTVLQTQDADAIASGTKEKKKPRRQPSYGRRSSYTLSSDESGNDSQSYFTSAAPLQQSARQQRRRQRSSPSPPESPSPTLANHTDRATFHVHNLPSPSSITAAISALWTHEGAWGVWKGTNSTFIHSILYGTITSFLRSLIFALLGLPEAATGTSSVPGPSPLAAIDLSTSSAPVLSLIAAVTASGIAGLVLAPVDIARTRLILTPSTHTPRSIIPTLRSLKSWVVPWTIAPATFLHSILPTFVATSTPIFLRSNLGIDPLLTPTTYAAATFFSQACELGMRLPVETILRRGQLAVLQRESSTSSASSRRVSAAPASQSQQQQESRQATPKLQTIVDVGAYHGLVGTMYHIVFEEGSRDEKTKQKLLKSNSAQLPAKKRKGQGLPGLFRGWRVGVWGLVGVWGAATLGNGRGNEF